MSELSGSQLGANAKWGFIDKTGTVVIDVRQETSVGEHNNSLAAVVIGGKWGYIDTTGKMAIEPITAMRAEDFHHGLAFVSAKDGKYGYIDKTGGYLWMPALLYQN